MGVSLGLNLESMRAQRALGLASQRVSTAFERLSSGSRINSASDDAAGLSIADKLRANSHLQGVAYRNINDGMSLLNIIGGTLDQQTGILSRLSELAEQSANGTYSSTQRENIGKEYRALIEEWGRLGSTTTFNGIKLLSSLAAGTPAEFLIQAGITGSSSSFISGSSANTSGLSGRIDRSLLSANDLTALEGTLVTISDAHNGMIGKVGTVNGKEIWMGLFSGGFGNISCNIYERLSNGDFEAVGFQTSTYNTSSGVVTDAGAQSATLTFHNGEIANFSYDMRGLQIVSSNGLGAPLGTGSNLEFTVVERATNSSEALRALDVISNRLSDLNLIKGKVGAMQSRLKIASDLALVNRETNAAAESRIRDVDVAEESAALVSSKIMQQTAAAVLAQANQSPNLLLSLLK